MNCAKEREKIHRKGGGRNTDAPRAIASTSKIRNDCERGLGEWRGGNWVVTKSSVLQWSYNIVKVWNRVLTDWLACGLTNRSTNWVSNWWINQEELSSLGFQGWKAQKTNWWISTTHASHRGDSKANFKLTYSSSSSRSRSFASSTLSAIPEMTTGSEVLREGNRMSTLYVSMNLRMVRPLVPIKRRWTRGSIGTATLTWSS